MKRKFPQVILKFYNVSFVYHLAEKSGNFGQNVNGKISSLSPKGNFLWKTGFLETQTKIPKMNVRMENVRSICQFLLVPGLLACIGLPFIRSSKKKSWKCNERIPGEISIRIGRVSFTTTVDQPVFQSKWQTTIISENNKPRTEKDSWYSRRLGRYRDHEPKNKDLNQRKLNVLVISYTVSHYLSRQTPPAHNCRNQGIS